MARRLAERGDRERAGRGAGVLMAARRAARSAASRLRLVAGRAFGRSEASERGTILLMVIGVLAMMSIITVVYVTIGQNDRRGAAALVREVRLDDQSRAIADYLAGVIRDDLFTVIEQETVTGTGDPHKFREAVDYPWMDESGLVVSIPAPGATGVVEFNPAGNGEGLVGLTPPNASRPLKIGQGGDPWLSATEPAAVRTASTRNWGNLPESLRLVDWPQISNFSPTGLFVNLWALRPNAAGFHASPGAGDFQPGTAPEMSEFLTLFNVANGDPQTSGTPTLPDGTPADPYVPAHWTRNQIWMHRPAVELDARAGAPKPGDRWYLPYQYADADGDGMIDSRWFEMVRWDRSREQFSPIIRSESPMRLFVAARCVDLSGLVNVQSAGDLEKGPLASTPLGITPADVDLRRLLTLSDAYRQYNDEVYQNYQRPPVSVTYQAALLYSQYDEVVAENAGLGAYGALRLALRDGIVPPLDCAVLNSVDPASEPFALPRQGRQSLYAELASAAEAARFDSTGAAYAFARPFGLADELELRTYHGANDSTQTSRFESVVAGRDPDTPVGTFNGVSPHCPLRSNRPLLVERGGRGDRTPTNPPQPWGTQVDGRPDRDALLQAATDIRRLLTFFSGARPLRTVEVVDGTDPIVGERNGLDVQIDLPGGGSVMAANTIAADPNPAVPVTRSDVRVDVKAALAAADVGPTDARGLAQLAVNRIFAAYATSLMPYLGEDPQVMWSDPLSGTSAQYRTLFYGYRGPDLAMRIAAHLTANLIDMYDGSQAAAGTMDDPTALRVYFTDPNTGGGPSAPGTVSGHFDVNLDKHMGGGQNWLRPAGASPPAWAVQNELRVYGIEAQPFLTEVAVFHMFTDAPYNGGAGPGDEDFGFEDLNGNGMYDDGEPLLRITINGDIDAGNADFLFQCIAFQVYNPFEFPIDMSQFYFEFGQTLFSPIFGQLLPGEHKVYFATNPGRGVIEQRMMNVGAPAPDIESWLAGQLGVDPAQITATELRRFQMDGTMIPPATVRDFFHGSLAIASPNDGAALLWRKLPGTRSSLTPEDRENDLLADRLRDPESISGTGTRSTWDRRFDLAGDFVDGTEAGPNEGDGDDTGFTITLYGTVVRPREASAASNPVSATLPLGAIPSFCIERKAAWDAVSLNTSNDDGTNPDSLSKSDFTMGVSGETKLEDLLSAQSGTEAMSLPGLGLRDDPLTKAIGKDPSQHLHNLGGPTPAAGSFYFRYPEIHLSNNRFGRRADPLQPQGAPCELLRPADLLLPMGIGPSRDMNPPLSFTPGEHPTEREWMTLAEALCLAVGADHEPAATPAGPDSPSDPRNPFHRFYEDVLDRGHLRPDWFVAFKDEVPPADFGQPHIFNVDADFAPYPAVPMAARVLDAFRVLPYGGERRAVPGLININTAPLAVLRLLPMFTPPYEGNWISGNNTAETLAGGNTFIWPRAVGPGNPVYDLAATAQAYRDKIAVKTRLDQQRLPNSGKLIDFSDDPTAPEPDGRAIAQIDALREEPGFSVPGEIFALQLRGRTDAANNGGRPTFVPGEFGGWSDPRGREPDLDCSITRFGRSAFATTDPNWGNFSINLRQAGIDSTLYEDPTNPGLNNYRPDELVNEYDGQLAIANAVLNSITTRSDLFCVWFIVHGYLPSDCEALGANDPLVPSIARRYVMVVDRSNVQHPTDRPRILLFQEVPM